MYMYQHVLRLNLALEGCRQPGVITHLRVHTYKLLPALFVQSRHQIIGKRKLELYKNVNDGP